MDPRTERVAALFHAQSRELTRLAYLIVGDWGLAEEAVQEAFLRFWGSSHVLRDANAAPAYLRRTVVNLCRSRIRRRALERRVSRGADARPAGEPEARDLDVANALGRLAAGKRSCIVLRYYADLTEAETAELLGVSVGTVKSQTSKALRQLAAHLAVDDPVVGSTEDGH
jgi:RNA polymerase sigma-70 factor (sigma-E family)